MKQTRLLREEMSARHKDDARNAKGGRKGDDPPK